MFIMKMKISFFLLLFLSFSLSVQAQFEASKRKVNISAKPDKAPKKKAVVPQNNPVTEIGRASCRERVSSPV